MESEPDYENVVFIDEYPQIMARHQVKLALSGLRRAVNTDPKVFDFPDQMPPPDDAA